ncbi:MAG: hypothetical protein Q9221_007417 [Calogaya cf. arnoldii]
MADENEPLYVRIYHMIGSQLPLDYMATDEGESTARRALDQAQREYPHVPNLTFHDYLSYFVNKSKQERIQEKASMPCYSLDDLWKFLHTAQLRNSNDADRWADFLNKSFFPEVIDLGLLDGKTPLRLAPGIFYFAHYGNYCPPNHGYVATRELAVEYQDCHAVKGAQYGPNSDDGVLRQFKEVGCILADKMGTNGMNGWDRTGHVLVIDMGVGRIVILGSSLRGSGSWLKATNLRRKRLLKASAKTTLRRWASSRDTVIVPPSLASSQGLALTDPTKFLSFPNSDPTSVSAWMNVGSAVRWTRLKVPNWRVPCPG